MSLLYVEEADSSKYSIGGSLLYVEEADVFSTQTRECLSSIRRGGRPLLCAEERVSFFSIQRRQPPSLYTEKRVSLFPIQRRQTLLYIESA